ncbi:MAG: hypothetical protein AAF563_06080 [Pseudomonadota bacterium]
MKHWLVPLTAVTIAWFVLLACVAVYEPSPVLGGRLVDSDSYMRLVRVGLLLEGGGWHDGLIARANAPYGDTLHWTRPFDVLIAAGALTLTPFAGPESGLFWSGALVSPMLQLATAFAFIWAMTPLLRSRPWVLVMMALAAVFLQPAALSVFALGHADHHSLLVLLFVLGTGCVLRALLSPQRLGMLVGAGLLAGLGLWVAPEALVATAVWLAALGFAWIVEGRQRAMQNLLFAVGLTIAVAGGLIAEQPLTDVEQIAHDRISLTHLMLSGLILAIWLIITLLFDRLSRAAGAMPRLIALVLAGIAAAAIMIAIDPAFFAGPLADVDPRIHAIWLDHVIEMQPVVPDSIIKTGRFVFYFGLGFVALPYLVWVVVRRRGRTDWLGWCLLLIALGLYWPLAVAHVRFAPYAEVVFVMATAGLVNLMIARTAFTSNNVRRILIRALCLYVVLIGPLALGRILMAWSPETVMAQDQDTAGRVDVATAEDACDLPAMAAYLEDPDALPGPKPRTILAFLDLGPELLYRTRHHVIATPYHRNGDGIYDSYAMLTAQDEARAQMMMAERAVDLILLCPGSPERDFFVDETKDSTLYQRLTTGQTPSWLSEISLPDSLADGFRLFIRNEESGD